MLPDRRSRAWAGAPSAIESFELQSGLPEPELGEAPPATSTSAGSPSRPRSSGSRPASRACSGSSARWSPPTTSAPPGRINAFTVAFQIPNLIRALVADAALSSAFVPVFSDLLEKGERRRAWRVASSLFWLMLLGLTALTASSSWSRRG